MFASNNNACDNCNVCMLTDRQQRFMLNFHACVVKWLPLHTQAVVSVHLPRLVLWWIWIFRVACLTLLSFKRYRKVITVTGKIYFPQKFLTVDVTVAVLCIWQHLSCRQCEQHFSPICSSYYQGYDSGGECGVPHERRFPMPRPSLDEAWWEAHVIQSCDLWLAGHVTSTLCDL